MLTIWYFHEADHRWFSDSYVHLSRSKHRRWHNEHKAVHDIKAKYGIS